MYSSLQSNDCLYSTWIFVHYEFSLNYQLGLTLFTLCLSSLSCPTVTLLIFWCVPSLRVSTCHLFTYWLIQIQEPSQPCGNTTRNTFYPTSMLEFTSERVSGFRLPELWILTECHTGLWRWGKHLTYTPLLYHQSWLWFFCSSGSWPWPWIIWMLQRLSPLFEGNIWCDAWVLSSMNTIQYLHPVCYCLKWAM